MSAELAKAAEATGGAAYGLRDTTTVSDIVDSGAGAGGDGAEGAGAGRVDRHPEPVDRGAADLDALASSWCCGGCDCDLPARPERLPARAAVRAGGSSRRDRADEGEGTRQGAVGPAARDCCSPASSCSCAPASPGAPRRPSRPTPTSCWSSTPPRASWPRTGTATSRASTACAPTCSASSTSTRARGSR